MNTAYSAERGKKGYHQNLDELLQVVNVRPKDGRATTINDARSRERRRSEAGSGCHNTPQRLVSSQRERTGERGGVGSSWLVWKSEVERFSYGEV